MTAKNRKKAFTLTVTPKGSSDKVYWFQNGKLFEFADIDKNRNYSSSKSFTTQKKLVSFLRYLSKTHKDTLSEVYIQREGFTVVLDNDEEAFYDSSKTKS